MTAGPTAVGLSRQTQCGDPSSRGHPDSKSQDVAIYTLQLQVTSIESVKVITRYKCKSASCGSLDKLSSQHTCVANSKAQEPDRDTSAQPSQRQRQASAAAADNADKAHCAPRRAKLEKANLHLLSCYNMPLCLPGSLRSGLGNGTSTASKPEGKGVQAKPWTSRGKNNKCDCDQLLSS